MKNKIAVTAAVTLAFFMLWSACGRRATPVDPFLPTPTREDCGKMGYYSLNYTHYWHGSYVYFTEASLAKESIVTSISANFSGSNEAIVMLYTNGGSLLAQSGIVQVSEKWNNIDIPDTTIAPGTYWIAVKIRYTDCGIRSENGAGTMYSYYSTWPNVPSIWTSYSDSHALLIYANYCEAPPTATPYIPPPDTFTHTPAVTFSATPTRTPVVSPTATRTATPFFSSTLSPTATQTPTYFPTGVPTFLPGCSVMGINTGTDRGDYWSNPAYLWSSTYALASPGVITSIAVKMQNAGGHIKAALYNGSDSKLLETADTISIAGWTLMPVTQTLLPAGTYKLVLSSSSGNLMAANSGVMYSYASAGYGIFPATLGSSNGTYNLTSMYVYANVCPPNTPTPTITTTRTLTQTPTLTTTPSPGATCTPSLKFGNDAGALNSTWGSTTIMFASSYTAPGNGTVKSISVRFAAPINTAVGIYDSGYNLLAKSGSVAVVSGWNTIPIADVAITSGSTYWLVVQSSASGGYINGEAAGAMWDSNNSYASGLPSYLSLGNLYNNNSLYIYANYCP